VALAPWPRGLKPKSKERPKVQFSDIQLTDSEFARLRRLWPAVETITAEQLSDAISQIGWDQHGISDAEALRPTFDQGEFIQAIVNSRDLWERLALAEITVLDEDGYEIEVDFDAEIIDVEDSVKG
jgi:hypothetical protein